MGVRSCPGGSITVTSIVQFSKRSRAVRVSAMRFHRLSVDGKRVSFIFRRSIVRIVSGAPSLFNPRITDAGERCISMLFFFNSFERVEHSHCEFSKKGKSKRIISTECFDEFVPMNHININKLDENFTS